MKAFRGFCEIVLRDGNATVNLPKSRNHGSLGRYPGLVYCSRTHGFWANQKGPAVKPVPLIGRSVLCASDRFSASQQSQTANQQQAQRGGFGDYLKGVFTGLGVTGRKAEVGVAGYADNDRAATRDSSRYL